MGNHDWLREDPYAMCTWYNAKKRINVTKDNTTVEMPYGSNQLHTTKGGTAPEQYYMPDFSYYYTIKDLGLELIIFDANGLHCCQDDTTTTTTTTNTTNRCPTDTTNTTEIYWDIYDIYNGTGGIVMGNDSFLNCCNGEKKDGGQTNRDVAQGWIRNLSRASQEMLFQRAYTSENHNFILANHYPEEGQLYG